MYVYVCVYINSLLVQDLGSFVVVVFFCIMFVSCRSDLRIYALMCVALITVGTFRFRREYGDLYDVGNRTKWNCCIRCIGLRNTEHNT